MADDDNEGDISGDEYDQENEFDRMDKQSTSKMAKNEGDCRYE